MSNGGAQFWSYQFIDSNGNPYSGVKVYHTAAGTDTLKTVWTDEGKTTAAANPVVGDSRGMVSFYADGDYKLVIKDSAGVTLYTWDNVKITSDTATMWEGNANTAYPAASTSNRWQQFLKHDASYNMLALGINTGTAFKDITLGIYAHLFTSFTDAVTAAAGKTLIIMESISLPSGAISISANVSIMFLQSGSITKGSATSLTITDPIVGNPMHQLFYGFAAGEVTFAGMGRCMVFPEWFGATGAAVDETTELQSAISSIQSEDGGIVWLLKEYTHASTLTVAGSGTAFQSVMIKGANGASSFSGGTGGVSMSGFRYTGTGTALLFNCQARAENFNVRSTASGAVGIRLGLNGTLPYSTNSRLTNIHVAGFNAANGIGLDIGGHDGSMIQNCSFNGNTDGIVIAGTGITINSCVAQSNARYGITNSDNNATAIGNSITTASKSVAALTIINNKVQSNSGGGIYLKTTDTNQRIDHAIIRNNYLESNGETPATGIHSIHVEGQAAGDAANDIIRDNECLPAGVGGVAVYVKNTCYSFVGRNRTYSDPATGALGNSQKQFENGGGNVALDYDCHLSMAGSSDFTGTRNGRRLPSHFGTGPFVSELIAYKSGVVDNTATTFVTLSIPNADVSGLFLCDYIVNNSNGDRVYTGSIRTEVARSAGSNFVFTSVPSEHLAPVMLNPTGGGPTITLSFTNVADTSGGVTAIQTLNIKVIADTSDGSTSSIRFYAKLLNSHKLDTSDNEITLIAVAV